TTKAFRFPNIPPGTVLIPSQKHSVETHDRKTCQRVGLPCTPGFALTDFKSQGKNLENVILGLYGRADRRQDGTWDKCEFTCLYVQLSRCKTLQGIQLLKPVSVGDFVAIGPGQGMVEAISKLDVLSRQTISRWKQAHPEER
ncbi:hypothetical protein B0T18DRAFT_320223, partial [Schizothecium vesticola]